MIISIKKKVILIIIAICLLITSVVVIGVKAVNNVYDVPYNGLTVVLDAGHGGIDGGVVGTASKVKESELNLAMAKKVEHYLKQAGYHVVLTRSNMDGLYGLSTSKRKAKDMLARKKIIDGASPNMVVSIHHNSYPLEKVSGANVYYSGEDNAYASVMQSCLNSVSLAPRVAKKADYYLLSCSVFPTVLVECGFLTNLEEEKKLLTTDYQDKIAYAIFSGINTCLIEKDL